MDTSLELIRAKIAELETKLADLHTAERELQALEMPSARKARTTPGPKPKRKPEASDEAEASEQAEVNEQSGGRQTIGTAITDVLGQHGPLAVGEIVEHIKATGRDIANRAVSFTLQALKKRGLVKSADGKWTLSKARSRRARA
jgi:hypothetical protein